MGIMGIFTKLAGDDYFKKKVKMPHYELIKILDQHNFQKINFG